MEHIRSHIAAIAFGLVVTLFGHDALMVADPHTTPEFNHAIDHELPVHDESCGRTTGAYPQIANGLDVDAQAAGQPISQLIQQAIGFFPHWSVEPHHPPDTRRALLQVYLN